MMDILNEDVCNQARQVIRVIHNRDDWDKAWWMLSSIGKFSVKYTWELLRQRRPPLDLITSRVDHDFLGIRNPFHSLFPYLKSLEEKDSYWRGFSENKSG